MRREDLIRKIAPVVVVLLSGGMLAVAQGMGAHEPHSKWIGTWAAAPMGAAANPGQPAPADATYRDIVHTSAGGKAYRVQFTNEFGSLPLRIGAATAALSAGNGAIRPATEHAITFHGQPAVTIPPGAMVYSDPIQSPLAAESNLAVSVYLPEQWIPRTTCHPFADSTNYITPGNAAAESTLENAWKIDSWCFVKGIDVEPDNTRQAAAVVTLGDSITDGAHSTRDANLRWPDILAQRLQANPATADIGVLNEGIGGNCILNLCTGPNAMRRFNRDVLAQSGVRYLIIFEGINDIGATAHPRSASYDITAQNLIYGMSQLVERAHEHGITVYGATITPYQGAGYYSDHGEQIREAVNQWIRTSGVFDGVIDFDKATRDAANPKTFAPAVGSIDHLHPGDPGYKIMGDSIDLSLFHQQARTAPVTAPVARRHQ